MIELKAAVERTPDIGSDDPRAVKLMIDYLYLGYYDPGTVLTPGLTLYLITEKTVSEDRQMCSHQNLTRKIARNDFLKHK